MLAIALRLDPLGELGSEVDGDIDGGSKLRPYAEGGKEN